MAWLCLGCATAAPAVGESPIGTIPPGGTLTVTAQSQAEFWGGRDDVLRIFELRVRITQATRLEGFGAAAPARLHIPEGQWLTVAAQVDAAGKLAATSVRKVESGSFYAEVRVNETDSEVFLEGRERRRVHPLERFLEEEGGAAFRFRPTDSLWFGGRLEQELEWEDETDLRQERRRDEVAAETELRLDMLWRLNGIHSIIHVEPRIRYEYERRADRPAQQEWTPQLGFAHVYVAFEDVAALHLGRQEFKDERRWLYDELLDGARIYATVQRWQGELALSRGRDVLAPDNVHEDTTNVSVDLRYFIHKRNFVSAWLVARDDSSVRNFSPVLFGVRSIRQPRTGVRHWAELARAVGEAGSEDIDGFGIDVGVGYVHDSMPRPYGFAGVAYGSGAEGTSQAGAFRQTGLQENKDRPGGGVSSYRYYGEVLDPELSNLLIATLGVGLRPIAPVSMDVVLHYYRQAQATTELDNTRLRAQPDGRSTALGVGLDLIVGARFGNLTSQLVLGRFQPAAAFDDADAAHYVAAEVDYKF